MTDDELIEKIELIQARRLLRDSNDRTMRKYRKQVIAFLRKKKLTEYAIEDYIIRLNERLKTPNYPHGTLVITQRNSGRNFRIIQ